VRVSNALYEQYLMHPIDYRLRDQISATTTIASAR
jgi:hypothetical protein